MIDEGRRISLNPLRRADDADAFQRWLDALDGGATSLGADVTRALVDALMANPLALVRVRYPSWFVRMAGVAEAAAATTTDSVAARSLRRLATDAGAQQDMVDSLIAPLMFSPPFTVTANADDTLSFVITPNSTQLMAHIAVQSASMQHPSTRLQRALNIRWIRSGESIDDERSRVVAGRLVDRLLPAWIGRMSGVISAMDGSDRRMQQHHGAALIRAVYANVLPDRVETWRRLRANRQAPFDQYVDRMEEALGVASSDWLPSQLIAAFSLLGVADGAQPIAGRNALLLQRRLTQYEEQRNVTLDARRRASTFATADQYGERVFAGGRRRRH